MASTEPFSAAATMAAAGISTNENAFESRPAALPAINRARCGWLRRLLRPILRPFRSAKVLTGPSTEAISAAVDGRPELRLDKAKRTGRPLLMAVTVARPLDIP